MMLPIDTNLLKHLPEGYRPPSEHERVALRLRRRAALDRWTLILAAARLAADRLVHRRPMRLGSETTR